MEKSALKNIKIEFWQRLSAKFLFCAIIFIVNTKKVFGQWTVPIADTNPTFGLAQPSPASIIAPIINWFLSILFSVGIIFYIIYFYQRINDKNINKRNKWIKAGTIIIIVSILTHLAVDLYLEDILSYFA